MYTEKLIPVFTGEIAGVSVQLVDARTLHAFLEVRKDFSTWLKNRIKQYNFQENEDYIRVEPPLPQMGDGENKGFQPIDYHLTLGMAKELSMVERNEKGKEARRYFIECERILLNQVPEHVARAYDELTQNKIPIHRPLTAQEFQERYRFHQNALESLEEATLTLSGKELLMLLQQSPLKKINF